MMDKDQVDYCGHGLSFLHPLSVSPYILESRLEVRPRVLYDPFSVLSYVVFRLSKLEAVSLNCFSISMKDDAEWRESSAHAFSRNASVVKAGGQRLSKRSLVCQLLHHPYIKVFADGHAAASRPITRVPTYIFIIPRRKSAHPPVRSNHSHRPRISRHCDPAPAVSISMTEDNTTIDSDENVILATDEIFFGEKTEPAPETDYISIGSRGQVILRRDDQ